MCKEFCLVGGGLCPSMHHRSHDKVGLCPGGSLCSGVCPGRSLSGGSLSGGSLSRREFPVQGEVSVQGVSVWGLCPGGSLSGGSLSMGEVSVQGVSVWGLCSEDLCLGVSVQGEGLCPGGLFPGGSMSRGFLLGRPPWTETPHTVTSGWYESYWNAFLLVHILCFTRFSC